MKYIYLLFILFPSFALSDIVKISKDFSTISSSSFQSIVEDKDKNISVLEILNGRYETNYKKDLTGPTHSVFWIKFILKNETAIPQRVILQNSRAGTDKIDIYVYKNKSLIAKHLLGDLRAQEEREFLSPKSAFNLELSPDTEYTIVSRLQSIAPMNLSWQIFNENEFLRDRDFKFIFNGLFAGVLIVLIIYNLLLFKNLRDISFLLYALCTFSLFWIQYTFSGMFYFLNLGINLHLLHVSAWFVPYLYSAIFIQFAISFFKIHEKDKIFFYILTLMSSIGIILSFLSLLLLSDESLAIYTPYSYIHLYLSMLSIFAYAIYATFKGYPLAIYFLLGEGIYIGTFIYSILIVAGVVNMSNSFQAIVPTGIMIEAIIFSIALSKRIKLLKQNSDIQEVLLVEESKFSAIGKSIGNAAHQWKKPLSQLSTHLLYMEALYHVGDEKKLLSEFGENIENMARIMNYMKGSIDELHDFYSSVDVKSTFKIYKQISLAMTMQNDKLILNNITVSVECNEEFFLTGAKHGFANILMILFENSIYQFEQSPIKDARIRIKVLKVDSHMEILFEDNAGGIKVNPIEKIFEMQFSTKGEEGCGLGLPLAKRLARNALYGDILVKNSDEGAAFTIVI